MGRRTELLIAAAGRAPVGITSATTNTGLTAAQLSSNPFLIRSTTAINEVIETTGSDFITTNAESLYVQDDFRVTSDLQLNVGLR